MTDPADVMLLTETFPYAGAAEETFLLPEVGALRERFASVTLVPYRIDGALLPVPAGIHVDTSLALQHSDTRAGLLRRAAIALDPRVIAAALGARLGPRGTLERWTASYRHHVVARRTRDWVVARLAEPRTYGRATVWYTYWLTAVTHGVVLAREEHTLPPSHRIVSRAHGYDLYEHRHPFGRFFGREETLAGLDALLLVSEHGRRHASSRYPGRTRYHVSRLGVPDPGDVAPPSRDGVFRIVSCSYVLPVKRVDLLYRGIVEAARRRPESQFAWTHIGGGPSLDHIKGLAAASPDNLQCRFPGHLGPAAVMEILRAGPADVFCNVSSSEGLPVSIMEAQSCGIPVIATAVGGTPEIVSDAVGTLLPPDPTAGEIAESLLAHMASGAFDMGRRAASRSNWEQRFDAMRNSREFAEHLIQITTGVGHVSTDVVREGAAKPDPTALISSIS